MQHKGEEPSTLTEPRGMEKLLHEGLPSLTAMATIIIAMMMMIMSVMFYYLNIIFVCFRVTRKFRSKYLLLRIRVINFNLNDHLSCPQVQKFHKNLCKMKNLSILREKSSRISNSSLCNPSTPVNLKK